MWQPIETAPKDGTMILTWDGKERCIDHWDESDGVWGNVAMRFVVNSLIGLEELNEPTHWMPLPEPPYED